MLTNLAGTSFSAGDCPGSYDGALKVTIKHKKDRFEDLNAARMRVAADGLTGVNLNISFQRADNAKNLLLSYFDIKFVLVEMKRLL